MPRDIFGGVWQKSKILLPDGYKLLYLILCSVWDDQVFCHLPLRLLAKVTNLYLQSDSLVLRKTNQATIHLTHETRTRR